MTYPLLAGTMRRHVASGLLNKTRRAAATTGAQTAKSVFSTKAQETETFLSGTSSLYAEQMYDLYTENPDSVHPSWKQYFDNLENGVAFSADDYSRPSTIPGKKASSVAVSPFVSLNCYGALLSRAID